MAGLTLDDVIRSARARMSGGLDYGYGPMTPQTVAGMPNSYMSATDMSQGEQAGAAYYDALRPMMGERFARNVAGARQIADEVPGVGAIAQAFDNPSIGSITNAAAQSAFVAGRPIAALKSLGAGYGTALASDMGVFNALAPSVADAGRKTSKSDVAVADLPGLSPEEQATYKGIMARLSSRDFSSGAERRALETQAKIFTDKAGVAATRAADLAADLEAAKRAADQAEYDRAVRNAEAARDKELGRVRRFSETEFGKTYDRTGGAAAFAGAVGLGALSRAATGPGTSTAGQVMNKVVGPALEGTGAAFTANSLPTIYDAMLTDSDNPEKAAYQAYARELPPTHPRKEEFTNYAAGLPGDNPVRTAAKKEYYDNMMPRLFISALEGIPGGLTGANGPALGGRAISAMRGGGSGRGPVPPGAGGSGGLPNPPPPPPPPPPAVYDPAVHGPISRAYVDELLTYRHPTREAMAGQANVPGTMATNLEGRFAASGVPAVEPSQLQMRASRTVDELQQLEAIMAGTGSQSTNPRLRQQILDMITGRPGMLAVPGAAIGYNALSGSPQPQNLLGQY